MTKNKNSAKLLLEISIGLGLSTLIITYLISTTSGRVAHFIPIISEMPFNEPESTIFGTGLGISIFSFLILAQVFHRIFKPLTKEIGENYENLNDLIRIFSSIGSVCGIITVNFHWNNYPILHGITAFILFTSFLIWGTFAYTVFEKVGKSNNIRKYAVYAGWAFSQTFFRDALYKQLGFKTIEDLLQDWENDHVQNWDANDLLSKIATWQANDISIGPYYKGDIKYALQSIRARSILITCTQDLYFPPEDNATEAQHIPNGELRTYNSPWGHCVANPGNDPGFEAALDKSIHDLLE